MSDLVTFVMVSAALICTPGPGTALTLNNSIAFGRRGGFRTAGGIVLGQAVWVVGAAVGISTLLKRSDLAMTILSSAGATYLCFLGVRSLRKTLSRSKAGTTFDGQAATARSGSALRDGLVSNLANPKMLVVATGVLPQFALNRPVPFVWTLLLGLIFCTITMLWLSLCTTLVWSARRVLARPAVNRAMTVVTGALLTGLGLRLLVTGTP